MKTFTELANEMGIQRQTLYRRYKDKCYDELQPHIKKVGTTILIDEEGEEILKNCHLGNGKNSINIDLLFSKIDEILIKIDGLQKDIDTIKDIENDKKNISDSKTIIDNDKKDSINNILSMNEEMEQIEKLLLDGKPYSQIRKILNVGDRKIKKVRDRLIQEGRL